MNFSWQWNWENLHINYDGFVKLYAEKDFTCELKFQFYSEDIELMKVKQTWTSSLTLSKLEQNTTFLCGSTTRFVSF